jgi:hypothetical protein
MTTVLHGELIEAKKLIIIAFFWLAWGGTVYTLSPDSILALIMFFVFLFLAVFLTITLLTQRRIYGLLSGILIVGILLFRFYQIGLMAQGLLLALFIALVVLFKR